MWSYPEPPIETEVNDEHQLIYQFHNKDLKKVFLFWIGFFWVVEVVFCILYALSILSYGGLSVVVVFQPAAILLYIFPAISAILFAVGAYTPYPRILIVNKGEGTMRVVHNYMLRKGEGIVGWPITDIREIRHDLLRNKVVAILADGQRKTLFRRDVIAGDDYLDTAYRRYTAEIDSFVRHLSTALDLDGFKP
jgi:hypothetical protein